VGVGVGVAFDFDVWLGPADLLGVASGVLRTVGFGVGVGTQFGAQTLSGGCSTPGKAEK
jgi:hypothetical protein